MTQKNTSKLSHRVKLLAFIKARLDDLCSQKKRKDPRLEIINMVSLCLCIMWDSIYDLLCRKRLKGNNSQQGAKVTYQSPLW